MAIWNEYLKNLRKSYNINQNKMAEKLNISVRTLVRIENGESEPSFSVIYKYYELFGVTPNAIFGIDEKNKKILELTQEIQNIIKGTNKK